MYQIDINKMNFKELRNEVQLLRDELAVMKRKFEDILYNLDDDNFSQRIIKEKNNMQTSISQTAEKIQMQAEKTTELENSIAKNSSLISQTAEEIKLEVSSEYETKDDADETYKELKKDISSISVRADEIVSTVENLEEFKKSVFTQTADGFTLDGEKTTFTGVIYLTDNNGINKFAIFHDESQGYEQILIHSLNNSNGLPIVFGSSKDILDFSNCTVKGLKLTFG